MIRASFYSQATRTFSRRWWFEQTRSLFWVALVTLMIWVYADLEFTEAKDFTAVVHFRTDPGSKLLLLSKNDVEVAFRARGNRGSLDSYSDQLRKAQGRIDVDVSSWPPGDSEVTVDDVLARDPTFLKAGLTAAPTSTGKLACRLDRLIQVSDVPVEIDQSVASLAGWTLTPAKITIQVAQTRWADIQQRMPKPVLRTEPINLQKMEPGKPVTMTAEVIPSIAGIPVEPQQTSVVIKGQIAKTVAQLTLTVNVGVDQPVRWLTDNTWNEYKLVPKGGPMEWQKQITVAGSKQDLELLGQEKQQVIAFIVLTEADKKPVESWLTRRVIVRFPDDVQVKLAEEPPPVQFRLEKVNK